MADPGGGDRPSPVTRYYGPGCKFSIDAPSNSIRRRPFPIRQLLLNFISPLPFQDLGSAIAYRFDLKGELLALVGSYFN